MKGQRVWRKVESGCDRAGWHALGSRLHKQAKHIQPIILCECGQGRDDFCFFHISTNIEMTEQRQVSFQHLLKYD